MNGGEMERFVFYDGDCGFCNKTVRFILKNDKTQSIKFAPLSSHYAADTFSKIEMNLDVETFYFLEDGALFDRSDAAFKLLKYLPNRFQILLVGKILPKNFRNWVYNRIAKRRKKIFKSFCYIPNEEERSRFIF